MQSTKIILYIIVILNCSAISQQVSAQVRSQKRIVIAAGTVFDGRGLVLHDVRIVIDGSKIAAVETKADPKATPADYDLRGLTVMPGWIDAHVHIAWSFGKDGKNASGGWTAEEAAYQAASNAWVTLMAALRRCKAWAHPPTFLCAMRSRKASSRARAS